MTSGVATHLTPEKRRRPGKNKKQNELQKHYLLLLLLFATHSGARFLFCCPAGLPVEGGRGGST